jgi:type II secretory ATPase GspE/PulE/Tfp pilus assembly ATPase PilB-like protein/molecular chaperone GrpE (heat shock protein)
MIAASPDDYEDLSTAMQQPDATPVMVAVNRILVKALSEDVAEIHFEPQTSALDVRFRKCGVLQPAFPSLPGKVTASVLNRVKTLAMMSTPPFKTVQEGRIRRRFEGKYYDFLVTVVPGVPYERVLLRVVNHDRLQPLEQMVADSATLMTLRSLLQQPKGLILVVGAPGSGKSTTLAALMMECRRLLAAHAGDVVMGTLENPIKYPLAGMTQTEWHPSKGVGFAEALQEVLAKNPQVLMVSELRDRAAMISALSAAEQRLVLATLAVEDLPSAITHLRGIGVDLSMIAGSLLGIVHQRLLQAVCPDCSQPHPLTQADADHYGLVMSDDRSLRHANTLTPDEIKAAKASDSLCLTCQGNGYIGQLAVHEVLPMTHALRDLLMNAADPQAIYATAVQQQNTTLLYSTSLKLVEQGKTTLAELQRVIFSPELVALHRQVQQQVAANATGGEVLDGAIDHAGSDPLDGLAELDLDLELANLDPVSPDSESLDSEISDASSPLLEVHPDSTVQPSEQFVSEAQNSVQGAVGQEIGIVPELALESLDRDNIPDVAEKAWRPEVSLESLESEVSLEDDLPDFDPELSLDSFELSDEAEAELEEANRHDSPPLPTVDAPEELVAELAMVRKQLMETALARVELQRTLEQQTKDLQTAQEKVQRLEQDKLDLKQQLAREREELTRKFDRQQVELRRKAKKEVVVRMLDAIDSFEQANAQLSQEEQDSSVHKGYRAIYRLMVDSLRKAGVTAVDSIGQPFNPEFHEAVMMEKSSQYPCDTVVGELRRGYMMDDTILRPAQVKVAVPSDDASPAPPEPPPPVASSSAIPNTTVALPLDTAPPKGLDTPLSTEINDLDAMFADLSVPSEASPKDELGDELDQLFADLDVDQPT